MPILTSEERIGTLLAEKYRLDRIIGKGGMGVVFGGEHTWTGRQVAVKIIHPTLAEDRSLVDRLLREARAAASLDHPNAVQVLDMGADADGTVFLVLEQLQGESLDARLSRPPKVTFSDALAMLLPVMNALATAHEMGLVHRDLKPDNIFLHDGATGVVPKLLDFGIAKVIQDGGPKVTQTGVVMGTPHYIAPEQAVGESTVGPPADVWAMGVIFFETLTGSMPFDGDSATKIVMKVVSQRAPRLVELGVEPRACAEAIDRALEPDLSRRYASMREFADALWAAASSSGFRSVPSVLPPPDEDGATIPDEGGRAFHTPADGSAPVVTFTPGRSVGPTVAMKSTPAPPMGQPTPTAAPATPSRAPWALVALAVLLVGAVVAVGGVVFFGGGDEPSPATAAPATVATEPAAPVPATTAPTAIQTEEATPAPVVDEPAAEPEPPSDVQDEPTEADGADEPTAEPARRRRRRRRSDDSSRRQVPEISSSW